MQGTNAVAECKNISRIITGCTLEIFFHEDDIMLKGKIKESNAKGKYCEGAENTGQPFCFVCKKCLGKKKLEVGSRSDSLNASTCKTLIPGNRSRSCSPGPV